MAAYQNLPVSTIDRDDLTYLVSRPGTDLSSLAFSIDREGLCTPLTVLETGPARFSIVSGFRRLAAAVSLNLDRLFCRIIPFEEKDRCPRIAVIDNAFQRELGPGELVRAVRILGRQMDSAAIAEAGMALFNTRLNQRRVKALAAVGSLPDPALSLLDRGRLSLKAAQAISPPHDKGSKTVTAFLEIFSTVRVSTGKQMEIITWANEICARDNIRMTDLFKQETVRQILDPDQDHKDMAAAGNRLRAFLFALRYPGLDEARQAAAARVRDLKLPKGIRLTLPDNFESMVYTLNLEFTGTRDLSPLIDTLSGLIAHPSFKALLDR